MENNIEKFEEIITLNVGLGQNDMGCDEVCGYSKAAQAINNLHEQLLKEAEKETTIEFCIIQILGKYNCDENMISFYKRKLGAEYDQWQEEKEKLK